MTTLSSGAVQLTFPSTSDTLAGIAATQTFTNKTISNTNNTTNGVTTNSNAAAGVVGEYVPAFLNKGTFDVSLSNATNANILSISLTAGDWEVQGSVGFTAGATTTITSIQAAISSTSLTLPTLGAENNNNVSNLPYTTGTNNTLSVGPMRISLSGTTTIYLIGRATFAISTMTAYGTITARRVR